MDTKLLWASSALLLCCQIGALGQQSPDLAAAPVIVQPGAPGMPNTTLTATDAAKQTQRPPSEADIRFMQDMIMHHGQAVAMTELLKTRTQNPEILALGSHIDVSQTDEMRYMKQWLSDRGIPLEDGKDMAGMAHSGMHHMDHANMSGMDHAQMAGMEKDPQDVAMMPGMLTPRQMQALRDASGIRFDELFLTGMIQHHSGALLMVKQLFSSPGAGQDPYLFDFANDVDNTQLAEIDIMKGILRKVKP